jgi:sugar phosphate permease
MAVLYAYLNWRKVFFLFGLVGLLWGVLFYRSYRDLPSGSGPAAAPHWDAIFWKKLIGSRSVWALGVQWFCHYYGFYFYITWLPIYLYQARRLDLRGGSLAAGLPLFSAALGCLAAGWTLSALVGRLRSTARARRLLGYLAYGGAAVLLGIFPWISNPALAVAVMSLSSFAAEFSSPISWTTAMDIGGERVGTVAGFMNMLGHLGGSVAPTITGLLLVGTANGWDIAFWASALIYAGGAVCWKFIDPVAPIE